MAKTEKSKDLSEIILSLENPLATTAPLPGWVVQFSTKDDSDLEEIVNGKTFGLQTLVDAFAKSLRDGEPKDYFSISINFNR